eukprot:g80916.t1
MEIEDGIFWVSCCHCAQVYINMDPCIRDDCGNCANGLGMVRNTLRFSVIYFRGLWYIALGLYSQLINFQFDVVSGNNIVRTSFSFLEVCSQM